MMHIMLVAREEFEWVGLATASYFQLTRRERGLWLKPLNISYS